MKKAWVLQVESNEKKSIHGVYSSKEKAMAEFRKFYVDNKNWGKSYEHDDKDCLDRWTSVDGNEIITLDNYCVDFEA